MDRSESIKDLACALTKLQGEMHDVVRDQSGFGYKYADLSAVLDATRPLLAKHKLAISQLTTSSEGKCGVTTLLMHETGEFISSTIEMPVNKETGNAKMSIYQTCGSCLTYLRRYSWSAIIGLTQTDNDGKQLSPQLEVLMAVTKYSPKMAAYVNSVLRAKSMTFEQLTDEQAHKLMEKLGTIDD